MNTLIALGVNLLKVLNSYKTGKLNYDLEPILNQLWKSCEELSHFEMLLKASACWLFGCNIRMF